MNRTTAAALIAAGVVGLVGGTVSAVVRGEDPARSRVPSAGSTARPGDGGSAVPVLYAGPNRIVDGTRTVEWDGPDRRLSELVRTARGYLVGFDPAADGLGGDHTSTELWAVRTDGTARPLATVRGRWDLDRTGDRIVGTDEETGKVTAWNLTEAEPTTWRGFPGEVSPVWVGDRVLVSAPGRAGGAPTQVFWDPASGKQVTEGLAGFDNLAASVAGDLVGGQVDREGLATAGQDANCLASQRVGDRTGASQWHTCDWRSNGKGLQYSPDGTRLISIPADSDGFGPGVLGILSAAKGPRTGVTEIDVPDATLGAEWLGNDRLLVHGASDLDLDEQTASVLSICDLDGRCREITRGEPGERLVVATVK